MKLTIVKIDEKGTTSDTIEYDGEPQHQAGFYPASEPNTGMVCGCRALWCYYRRGKRVATIHLKTHELEESFLRGRPTGIDSVIIPQEWNCRLKPFRIFWPARVEIMYGDSGPARYQKSMQLWLTDGKRQTKEPEQCECSLSGCYLHPADDDDFHETPLISTADRDWISERDREAERFAQTDTGFTRPAPPDFAHADGFRCIRFRGTTYTFTPQQATVVNQLWEAWEEYTPDVSDAALLESIETRAFRPRLRDVFKEAGGRMNPAWGNVIVKGRRKGTRRLNLAE